MAQPKIDGSQINRATLYQPLAINAQVGTAFTLLLTDGGNMVTMNNASANTLTVPPNASVAFPIGTEIVISQEGAGQTTIAPGAGVTINSAGGLLSLSSQYSSATLVYKGSDVWLLMGDLA